ncbi:radical SAM protein [Williamsia serinedens]|uniref:Radical SAM additional 4Fe4S-binding SPASM domain-containing protein n=1 Tax=Williamsia serinedens TaxID=391736 RepID=A0ABT1GW99_9NOCA|nr:radical SAM protein [Williamsia serinedens]MCP2159254.1 radical SAM additional 4Fe4S-binding SPASM domain-containing protein [Williamsia serinedens]
MTAFGANAQIMITERCNLKCVHCAVPEESSPADTELTTAEWGDFIKLIAEGGVEALTISGGEATLRDDAPLLLEAAAAARIPRVTLLTNGLLRNSVITELVAVQRRHSNVGIHVSLDGASTATHDVIRGRGTFRATMTRIESLRAAGGVITGVHTVLHRDNVDEFEAIVAMVSELGASVWTIFPVAALGRAQQSALTSLTAEQWADVTARLAHVRNALGIDVGQMGPVLNDDWPADASITPRGRSEASSNVVVGPDGAIFTCPPLRDHLMGDVRTQRTVDDWRIALQMGEELTESVCRKCQFRLLCTGIDPDRPFRTVDTPEWSGRPDEILARQPSMTNLSGGH